MVYVPLFDVVWGYRCTRAYVTDPASTQTNAVSVIASVEANVSTLPVASTSSRSISALS